jgi:hypothetical protein
MACPAWVLMVSGLLLARAGLFEELRTDGACPMNTEATGVAWSNGAVEMVQGA